MAGIQVSGLASGLDTDSIITQLMSIESQPRTRMARQQVTVQARQDALRQVDTKLTDLKLAASDLRSALLWTPTQSVASSTDSVLSARMTGAAAPGAATVTVQNLASAAQRTIEGVAQSGHVTISSGGSYDYSSLDDLVSKINADDQGSVYAVNVNGALVLSRRVTGAAGAFTATFDQPPTTDTPKPGQDAHYTVDGGNPVSSASNVVTNGLPGIELTLKTVGTSTVDVSNPAADPSKVADKLKAFVSAYNDAITFVQGKLTEKPVSGPQTDADAQLGVLYGDMSLQGVLSDMRQMISTTGLDKLGVKVPDTGAATDPDALAGKLTFDQATFDAAWAAGPRAVQDTLGSVDKAGFAQQFEALLDPITRAGDGLLDQRVSSADGEISSIKDQLAQMDERLQSKEDYLRAQFTAMEQALSQSQTQSSWLASQLAGLTSS